jgi:hypothetical protein
MYRRSYFSDQKQKLIDLIVARTGTPRSELAAKTIQELEAILDDSLMAQIRGEAAQATEAADEELIRIQGGARSRPNPSSVAYATGASTAT